MPRFAANLSTLFTEVPFLERFERAAAAGFDAVEFLFPYEFDSAEVARRLERSRLELVLFNTPPGDLAKGDRGLACLPDRVDEFRAGFLEALRWGSALGVRRIHCMAGRAPEGIAGDLVDRTYVANLRFAAAAAERRGIGLLIEPINTYDMPGYYLTRTAQALELIDEVGAENLQLQYDIYHAQRSEGELAATIEKHLARIGHMQLADNPGRHEPGTGEICYPFLFERIDALGYGGHVGCEYRPQNGTEAGLGWFRRARDEDARRRERAPSARVPVPAAPEAR